MKIMRKKGSPLELIIGRVGQRLRFLRRLNNLFDCESVHFAGECDEVLL